MRLVGVLIGLLLPGTERCFVDPISPAVGAGLATGGPYVYSAFKDWISKDECLTGKAINAQALQKDFDRSVFGQHLVRKVVLKAVTGFLENSNPKKPLVLIFHGTTGTGKSYVSHILARNIYPKGVENRHIHWFSGPLHFTNDSLIKHYKAELRSHIKAAVSSCQRSIFIFEEADVMDPSLIDAITPFLDHRIQIDGVSYGKAIFIFQSNAGGELIHDLALKFWKDGKKRESIQLKEVEHKLSLYAFNQKNIAEMKSVGVLIGLLLPVRCFVDPISLAVGAGLAAGGSYVYSRWKTMFSDDQCLLDKGINVADLQSDYDSYVFGQHLVKQVVLRAVVGFLENNSPKKPLVLAFHGWTGTGKNHVSQILARNIYPKGQHSQHVHQFSASLDFSNDNHVELYKAQLQSWIRGNVSSCARSIFIFDEVDKMHPRLVEAIMPFLDYNDQIGGVSYQKAMFIFLSNAGGEYITEVALKFWREGKRREDIKLSDVEHVLSLHAFNKKNSGFWHSSLIDKSLVDFFVPFLPLEFEHVKMCVRAELRRRTKFMDEGVINAIAREMTYDPKDEKIYSVKGCKTVAAKVDYY